MHPFRCSPQVSFGVLLLILLGLAGCSPSSRLSVEGERRCREQVQRTFPLWRPLTELRCRRTVEVELAGERRTAAQRQLQERQAEERRQAEHRRCRQEREAIGRLVATFEGQQALLKSLLGEAYRPGAAPRALSPEERRGLPMYDQELLDERYGAELAAWRQREQERRQEWERRQGTAVAAARDRLNALSQELRVIDRRLVSPGRSPSLNPEIVRQLTACP